MPPREFFKLKVGPGVEKALQKVGVPRKRAFKPDAFQLEAVEKLRESDVLVSAPTGAGKTWIAAQAMEERLDQGGVTWYASPLKALSNAKYREFQDQFGPSNVGILTGDRKENTSAPILIGTTEIFRNRLYDAMHRGENLHLNLVILDEAHYLGDPDRGMVWEEILIYLPSRIRLLLLSATISNAEQIAEWLIALRGNSTSVVKWDKRPVPLFSLFLFPDGELEPLLERGRLSARIRKFEESRKSNRFRSPLKPIPLWRVLSVLRELHLTPAIFFLKSRSDCNMAISQCFPPKDEGDGKQARFEKALDELLREMPFLENYPQLADLRKARVASHHGGQLPYWKLLVESLMKEGHLDAIFATSTVAAGVNFPARTVGFMNSDRFNGRTFQNLTSTELHQMLGRAGRRGMDRIGFALVLPGPYQRPALVAELLKSEPEPIMSQMRVSFSMALNILLSHAPEEARELLRQSLYLYQNASELQELEEELDALLEELDDGMLHPRCGSLKEALRLMEKQQELTHLERYLKRKIKGDRLEWFRRSHLVPGRVFFSRKRKRYCVVDPPDLREGNLFRATPLTQGARPKKGRLKLREFDIRRIGVLLDKVVDLSPEIKADQATDHIRSAADLNYPTLSMSAPLHTYYAEKMNRMEGELKEARDALKRLPCEECGHKELCHGYDDVDWKNRSAQAGFLLKRIDAQKEQVWLDFKRHLEFMQEKHFVDGQGRLTEDGLWAARLRLDHPLLIAEGIRKGAFHSENPAVLCGLVAVFIWERTADSDLPQGWVQGDEELFDAFENLADLTLEFKEALEQAGFSTPRFQYRPAATLFSWASGATWEEIVYLSDLDEGDLAMMIYRTADNLRQLADLKDSHPELAALAAYGAHLILREPVLPY